MTHRESRVGRDAVTHLAVRLEASGVIPPLVHRGAVGDIEGGSGINVVTAPHFLGDGPLHPLAAYDLMHGFSLQDGRVDSSIDSSLRRYWEFMPDRPDMFAFVERSNGYDQMLNLLARSRTALVSQQISLKSHGGSAERFNRCTQAYNDHLVPVLESTEAHSRVIVLFSTFRGYAALLSDIEEARVMGAAPRQLGPMPPGFSVVYPSLQLTGVRPDQAAREAELLEIAQRHFSPEISAAATYLATCLSTQQS